MITQALKWRGRGFRVIPVIPGTKSSAVKWSEFIDGQTDELVSQHWGRHPEHLVAIATDGVVIVDCDDPLSEQRYQEEIAPLGPDPFCMMSTPRGSHYYYHLPEGLPPLASKGSKEPGFIDIKTGTAYVVVSGEGRSELFYADEVRADITFGQIAAIHRIDGIQWPLVPKPQRRSVTKSEDELSPHEKWHAEQLLSGILKHYGSIDAIEHDTWRAVVFGLKVFARSSEWALDLLQEHTGDPKNQTENAGMWARPEGGEGITGGSLVHVARECGVDVDRLQHEASLRAAFADVPDVKLETPAGMPGNYVIADGVLCAIDWKKGEDGKPEPKQIPICQALYVMAETADETGSDSGLLLQWTDKHRKVRQWPMPKRLLIGRNGDDAISVLVNEGLQIIDIEKRKRIADYLMRSRPTRDVWCANRTGWYKGGFVLPHEAIGRDDVLLQAGAYAKDDYTALGTLAEWQNSVAAKALGNSRLAFAISTALAAPLLDLANMSGGGFHLKGESTDGKTTCALVAASVYGEPRAFTQSWRATGNAIEGIASRRNDALLVLDEIGEVDGREAGNAAYMLANGQGKGRSHQSGELRMRKAWRLLFLSTGELSLEDHAASAGQRTQAGMEIRCVQIPSDAGAGLGAFENLHGLKDGAQFADSLIEAISNSHGTAFRAFISALTADLKGHSENLKADIKRLAAEMMPDGAGNQVKRAINRFALVAAAGELATRLGVTGWPEGEAVRAVRVCFDAWLASRGHLGNQEDAATLRQIRQFVTAHQFSRFASWHDPAHRPANMVGYRKQELPFAGPGLEVENQKTTFYILPEGWREICKGRDPAKAAKLAMDAGLIAEHDAGKMQKNIRIPGAGKTVRCYALGDNVLSE